MHNEVYLTVDWLKNNFETLSKQHKKIASYLMESPTSILSLSIDEFASEVGVSRATVFRFCKVLGFNGYTDLRGRFSALRVDIDRQAQSPHMQWLNRSMYDAVYYTLNNLDLDAFSEAVSMLRGAKRIYWFGAGESGILGELGNHRCWLLGIDSYAFRETLELLTPDILRDQSNVFIFLSVSGYGSYLDRPLQLVREHNLPCIAITSKRLSPLTEVASVNLYAASPRSKHGTNIVPIKTGFEALINALLYETARERGIELILGNELF